MAALQQLQQLTMLHAAGLTAQGPGGMATHGVGLPQQMVAHRRQEAESPAPGLGSSRPSSGDSGTGACGISILDDSTLSLLKQNGVSAHLLQSLLRQQQSVGAPPVGSSAKGMQSQSPASSPTEAGPHAAPAGSPVADPTAGMAESPAFISELVKRMIRKELRSLKDEISRVVDAKLCPLRESIDMITNATQQMQDRQANLVRDMVIEEANEMRDEYNDQMNAMATAMEEKLIKLNTQQHKLVHEARIFARQHQKSTVDLVAQSERRVKKDFDTQVISLRTDLLNQSSSPRSTEGETEERQQGTCHQCGQDSRRIQKLEIALQAQQAQLREMDHIKGMMKEMQEQMRSLQQAQQGAQTFASSAASTPTPRSPLSAGKRKGPEGAEFEAEEGATKALAKLQKLQKPVPIRVPKPVEGDPLPQPQQPQGQPQARCLKFSKTTFRSDLRLPRIQLPSTQQPQLGEPEAWEARTNLTMGPIMGRSLADQPSSRPIMGRSLADQPSSPTVNAQCGSLSTMPLPPKIGLKA